VVIAVIAILAAMLLPALASARARAWRLNCATNIRQIGVATVLFQGDHGDRLPPGGVSGGSITTHGITIATMNVAWDGFLHKYLGDVASPDYLYLQGIVDPDYYPKVELCPADRFTKGWPYDAINHVMLDGMRTYSRTASAIHLSPEVGKRQLQYTRDR